MGDLLLPPARLHGVDADAAARRIAYASFVSFEHRYVFMETPKAACSTLKWIVAHLEGAQVNPRQVALESTRTMCIHHRPSHRIPSLMQCSTKEFERILEDREAGWVRFCVVRNPYARLASAWADKVRQREPGYAWVWKVAASRPNRSADRCPSFGEFVRWVTTRQDPLRCNHHWRPMTPLLMPDLLRYTHVLQTERLEQGLSEVLRLVAPSESAGHLLQRFRTNESLPFDWRAMYDEATASAVLDYYRDDFARYGYAADSWRQVAAAELPSEARVQALESALQRLEAAALTAVRARNDAIEELAAAIKAHRHARNPPGRSS